jgi:ribonuclease HII
MERIDAVYPGYGFARHKGYITRAHEEAVIELGVSPAHRRSVRCKAYAALGLSPAAA